MRWLVTGAGGFTGRRLVPGLLAAGFAVDAIVRPRGGVRGEAATPPGAATVHAVDVNDRAALAQTVAACAPDVVVHLAVARADATPAKRELCAQTNVMATVTLLEAAAAARVRRFVHVGGALEYGAVDGPMDEDTPVAPHGHYGATKAAASLLVRERGRSGDLETVVLRPFLVYGPGQRSTAFIPSVLAAARAGTAVTLTEGAPARDWVHVDDLAAACVAAGSIRTVEPGLVVNVGTGRQWTNDEVVQIARRVTARPIAVAAERTAPRPWDRGSWLADPRRLTTVLGVHPRDLEQGLAELWGAAP